MLSEVVVIGYGTIDKKELTSAVSHVSAKDFQSVATTDVSMLIQGKVPGLSVVNTAAADPNSAASLQIRGVSSREAGLGPLIVLDGVPGSQFLPTSILTISNRSTCLKTVPPPLYTVHAVPMV